MPESIHLDTTIHESIAGSEVEMLLFALERSRAQFAWKVSGLDSTALNRPQPPSAMTLGGLIKHLARCEDEKIAIFLGAAVPDGLWRREDFAADPNWDFHSAAGDSPTELYRLWQAAVARSRSAWNAALANGALDQPSKRTFPGWGTPNLRRVIVDLHDEYARHVGHADLMREAIDGLVGEDPPQP
jgi:hypothetical protein